MLRHLGRQQVARQRLAGRAEGQRVADGVLKLADAVQALEAYDWPGNVRELENAVRHALTFRAPGQPLTRDLLPTKVAEHKASAPQPEMSDNASLKSFLKRKEREYIEHILSGNGGDKEKAAELLKVNLSTLYRKLADDRGDSRE